MRGGNQSFLPGLFQRSKRRGFITSHERFMRARVPIIKRIKRIHYEWKNMANKKAYSSSRGNWLTRRNVFWACTSIIIFFLLFSFKGVVKKQLLSLDIFPLTKIEITGCQKTSREKIREYAGIKYNTTLLAMDPKSLRERLETHPWVLGAEVTRKLPDTLLIKLQEYVPKAIIQLGEEEDFYYVDYCGTPFVQLEAGQDMDFPVITGLERMGGSEGEGFKGKLLSIMEFLKSTDKDDANLPAQSVSQFHFDPRQGVILFLVDFPFPIFLGKDNIQNEYNRLRKVVGFLYKERKKGMKVNNIAYIRMDYSGKKVLVARTDQVDQ